MANPNDVLTPDQFNSLPKTKGNRKVMNAVAVVENGVKFDSRLELAFKHALTEAKLPFVFKRTYILVDDFIWNGRKVQDIKWTPDYTFDDIRVILDTKGHATDVAELKIKLCKYMFFDSDEKDWHILIVKTKKEFPAAIELLKMYFKKDFGESFKILNKKFEV